MTEDEIKAVAETAAIQAVKEVLLSLGIDTNNPIQTQRQIASLSKLNALVGNEEYQKDQLHLRNWRNAMESASKLSIRAIIVILVTGTLGMIWLGIQQTLGKL